MPKNRPSKAKRDAKKYGNRHKEREKREHEAAKQVVDDESLDFPAKIDHLAEARRWFTADTTIIDKYMSNELSTAETVEILAKPVDEAYSSADFGRQWHRQEMVARGQRKYHGPEKALEMWGPEEDWPEPETKFDASESTEMLLWDLWYSILHAAKRIPYTNDSRHEKLVELVRAFKARPNPPPPVPMTIPLKREWIWESGKLWTDLTVLGISVAEVSNDSPGCGAGWLWPELRAWENVNAFLARLTASHLMTFQSLGLWALKDATERSPSARYRRTCPPSDNEILSHRVILASLWVTIAGEQVFAEYPKIRDQRDIEVVDRILDLRDDKLPWTRSRKKHKGRARWETARREFVRRRLEVESHNEGLPLEAREMASKATKAMIPFVQFGED
ncbi:uncharacterized protein NECHADRAFT_82950 [Fusarium vanettenii 77-13-4]|uniref:Uncharacterized protein n=1 Tax=Fusarium vanettenii (strain ATCC MYA-4622 / CBS 123669 / FGSC 9596 / NRRL 45880 / 77-13-4) TaxID=660122 RepID=C7YXA7_FUSV7|nr:uncharacterized protein NECHADRAFT_82950 [Fusarium vanettenii 77-13-4]EEU43555.1 hypothetical protein NECHADRAFT_82950 [Fusarium vanettenii 77-13-4]